LLSIASLQMMMVMNFEIVHNNIDQL